MLWFLGLKTCHGQNVVGKTSEMCFSMHFVNLNKNLKKIHPYIHSLPRYQISGLCLSTTVEQAFPSIIKK
ncbi:hypothetical protein BYT27DRAFT_6866507 [Phlegmacium glaucopus]|nr:hypothetical protein BYT27DRAFT_6866507 [Phlegmacium glaucopus]